MTREDCLAIIMASPIYTGQDSNRCSKNHRLFVPSQQSASPLLHPWFLNSGVLKNQNEISHPPGEQLARSDLVACSSSRKNISRECSRKFFRNVVYLLPWKLIMMAFMRDLWVLHKLTRGTLLSESISTLRLYFGTQWLW